jgi:hypothetical protein
MNAEEAQGVMFNDVWLPTFVEKCAARGLHFSSEEELRESLETASLLKFAEQNNSQSAVKAASADLRTVMGVPQPEEIAKAAQDHQVTQQQAGSNRVSEALAVLQQAQPQQ